MDVDVVRSDGIDIDPEIQAEINECIAYADALRDRGIDARVEGSIEVTYETLGDLVQRFHDHTKEILVRHVQLERANIRLRDMMDVASQRVARTMPNTRSGASRTREGINERGWSRGVNGNGGNRNGENGNGGNGNGGNGNGGNENGNGKGGGNGYNFGGFVPARELTRWFEKMETVFYISNCPKRYQVKYASCTILNGALTWWNSHKRTIGIEAAYAMSWAELMKLMTEVYCPRNEVQKMETELWNLAVKEIT
ncbi:hypothetical protein Tco_1522100 [Tanacetum coccineum]